MFFLLVASAPEVEPLAVSEWVFEAVAVVLTVVEARVVLVVDLFAAQLVALAVSVAAALSAVEAQVVFAVAVPVLRLLEV